VIKADGLAAGKGVVVAMNEQEAHDAVDMMLTKHGERIVIEEFLSGEEASFIVMVDGKNILPLATSQDHKRLLDNDQGPNTGGMGAYSPAPIITPQLHARVMREIIQPTVQAIAKDGILFTGFLYAGLMIDEEGNPKTLEFNCRLGDPETQPIMARLKSDFVNVLEQAVNGQLDEVELTWDRRTALGVVMAAAGYPDTPVKGAPITGIPPETTDCVVFHAGTRLDQEKGQESLTVNGGRVLCVVGLGDNIKVAQKNAYDVVDAIQFKGSQARRDIGWRAMNKKS
jgi:phosphoribosylamine--glycine ligase